jgi:hypothetical protein
MNITSLSGAASAAALGVNTASGIGKATNLVMLNKTLDASEQEGAALVKMMEQSVNPSIGGNIDITA